MKQAIKPETDRTALKELLTDVSAFDALEARLARFNVFEAVGLVRQEIRHSNLLGFMLDPSNPHGLGNAFLTRILAATSKGAAFEIGPPNSIIVKREWRNLDLLVECRESRTIIVIENKVGSGEHSDQLRRYRDTLAAEYPSDWHRVLILLSPTGVAASDPHYAALGYGTIHAIVGDLLERSSTSMLPDVTLVLRHYRELLETHVIEDKELDALCDAVYAKHRRALDLIFERRAGPRAVVNEAINGWIARSKDRVMPDYTSNRYIKFLPIAWKPFSPVNDTHKGRERHMLTVLLTSDPDRLNVSVELHKGSPAYRELVQEIARTNQPPFNMKKRSTSGKEFSTLYSRDVLLPKDYEGADPDELRGKVGEILESFAANDLAAMTEKLVAQTSQLQTAEMAAPS